jgi:site-specific DNA-cytosine methylase
VGPASCVDLNALDSLPEADLCWASPPCQPFSVAGTRKGSWKEKP